MNTPPKATCHSCNGTGIDPTVGFLDCEFCTPAFAGVSLSAPEQPEPKCPTCNDHGEVGCLRPDGYDGERCPECNPATVKRYHVTLGGLVEGQALGRLNAVLAADHDRVTAERDALRNEIGQVTGEYDRALNKIDALQQLLAEADERVDVLKTALKKISVRCLAYIEAEREMPEPSVEVCQMIAEAALKPAEARQ